MCQAVRTLRGSGKVIAARDVARVDAVAGGVVPRRRLPIDPPRSIASVPAQRSDAPGDSRDPLYPLGLGAEGYRR